MEFLNTASWINALSSDFAIVLIMSMATAAILVAGKKRSVSKVKPISVGRAGAKPARFGMQLSGLVQSQTIVETSRVAQSLDQESGPRLKGRRWNLANKGQMPTRATLEAQRSAPVMTRPVERFSIQQQFEKLTVFLRGNIASAYNAERLHDLAGRQLDAVDYALINLRDELADVITQSKIAEAALISTARGEPLRPAGQHRRLASDRGPARSRIAGQGLQSGAARRRSRVAAA